MNHFDQKLSALGVKLKKRNLRILQVNVGKLCNLACVHCHVEAGPTKKKENMSGAIAEAVVQLMDHTCFETLDITGGAPELNPNFRYLVTEGKRRKLHVIDRSNLTVFFEPRMEKLPNFLAENGVEIIASLPCYSSKNVDQQRGRGTFVKSIEALRRLNRLGYGQEALGLILNLVYNPVGPHLPPSQAELEAEYKERLREDFGIIFNRLYTITNMPMTRYVKHLKAFGQYESYVELLINSFNSGTLERLMCRDTLSVSWDGALYDCDFNQMLGMQMRNGTRLTIFDLALDKIKDFEILTGDHCFGCTAGTGSSCQGALTSTQEKRYANA